MNETVAKQGAPSVTGVVYGFHEDENYKYLDVRVTAGPWAVTDTIVGAENSQLLRLVQLKIDSILLTLKVISLMTFRSKVTLVARLHNPLHSLRIRQQFSPILVVLLKLIQRHYSELSRRTLLYIQRVPDNISMLSNMMVSMLKLVRELHLLVM